MYDGEFCKTIIVCEDFPIRITRARNAFRKFLRVALASKKKAYLKYNKLVIENDLY